MTYGTQRLTSHERGRTVALTVLLASLTVTLAACGAAPGISIGLDATSVELIRGGIVVAEVTLVRSGGVSDDVSLSVAGLPAGVTASFAPATLSGATLSSTLKLSSTPAAVEGNYDLTVTGTGAGLSADVVLLLDLESLTVKGHLLGAHDVSISNANVESQGATAVTNADGSFSLTGLSVPYDLSVWSTAGEWAHVYQGLSSAEPVLSPPEVSNVLVFAHNATLTGTLSGGVIPVGTDQAVMVCVEGIDGTAHGCDGVDPTENTYSIDVQWVFTSSRTVRVHAVQFQRDGATGFPVDYLGYGTAEATLDDGGAEVADIDLGAALESTSVTVDVDTSAPAFTLVAGMGFESGITMPLVRYTGSDVTQEFVMPLIEGTTFAFAGKVGDRQLGWQVGVTGPAVSVTIPDPPAQISPDDGAIGITPTSQFSASNPTGGPLTYSWIDTVGGLSFGITTMATSVSLPDLTEFGLALPAANAFIWRVTAGTGPTIDSATHLYLDGGAVNSLIVNPPGGRVDGSGTYAESEADWTFTTAP